MRQRDLSFVPLFQCENVCVLYRLLWFNFLFVCANYFWFDIDIVPIASLERFIFIFDFINQRGDSLTLKYSQWFLSL